MSGDESSAGGKSDQVSAAQQVYTDICTANHAADLDAARKRIEELETERRKRGRR